jgi:Uma2 family endonuclease
MIQSPIKERTDGESEISMSSQELTEIEKELLELGIAVPPTQADLPNSDGDKMETGRHKLQMDLLIETLYPWLQMRSDGFCGGNMFVYYSLKQVKNQDFKGPDFFVALDVPKGERLSWVCWEEGKSPDVIIELLSPSTAQVDKVEKKRIYQDWMKVSEYYWFNPFNIDDFKGFHLQNGHYEEIEATSQGNLISETLDLELVKWDGEYYGVSTIWLRWADRDGNLIPTQRELKEEALVYANEAIEKSNEAIEKSNEALEKSNEAIEKSNEKIQQIINNLKAIGMNSEQISEITNIPIEDLKP